MNCPPLSAVCSTIRSCAGLIENRLSGNANGPEMCELLIAMSRLIGTGSSVLLGSGAFLPGTRIRGTGGRMSDVNLGAACVRSASRPTPPALNCIGAGVPRPPCGGGGGTGVPRPFVGTDGGENCGCCDPPCVSYELLARPVSCNCKFRGGAGDILGSSCALRYTWMA